MRIYGSLMCFELEMCTLLDVVPHICCLALASVDTQHHISCCSSSICIRFHISLVSIVVYWQDTWVAYAFDTRLQECFILFIALHTTACKFDSLAVADGHQYCHFVAWMRHMYSSSTCLPRFVYQILFLFFL